MKKLVFLTATLGIFLIGSVALAQTTPGRGAGFCNAGADGKVGCTYTALEPLPGLPNTYGPGSSIGGWVGSLFTILFALGAIVGVAVLVLGGLTYMFSDVVTNKFRAKERIQAAMWGVILLAASWLILNTINPQLITFNLNINPTSKVSTPSAGVSQTGTYYTPSLAQPAGDTTNRIDIGGPFNVDSPEGRAAEQQFEQNCRNRGGVVKVVGNQGGFSPVLSCTAVMLR